MKQESVIEILVPPLPYYIENGEVTYQEGQSHISRQNLGVFDLITVTKGRLYIGEDQQTWTVNPGEVIILRPDCHHYATQKCLEETHFYWMHFQTAGVWFSTNSKDYHQEQDELFFQKKQENFLHLNAFKNRHITFAGVTSIKLPQHLTLPFPDKTFEKLRALMEWEKQSSFTARWEQQTIFQNILLDLNQNQKTTDDDSSAVKIANAATSFLRKYYQKPFSYQYLGEILHFHPTYIARCVKKVYGCTLLEYLIQYRLKKARLLLLSTNLKISSVAEQVGFDNPVYFTRRFKETEGLSPQQFRKYFRVQG